MDRNHIPRREPLSPETFARFLEEEVEVAYEYELALSLLVVVLEEGWGPDEIRKVLGVLRAADLTARPTSTELAVALPNTGLENARAVALRLREAVPQAAVGAAIYIPEDAASELLERARDDVQEG